MRLRRPDSKGETLLAAVLYTIATLLWIVMAVRAGLHEEEYTRMTMACTGGLVVIGTVISGVYWTRWFKYDKK